MYITEPDLTPALCFYLFRCWWIMSIILSCSSFETPMVSKACLVPQSGQMEVLWSVLEIVGVSKYMLPQRGQVCFVRLSSFNIPTPPYCGGMLPLKCSYQT